MYMFFSIACYLSVGTPPRTTKSPGAEARGHAHPTAPRRGLLALAALVALCTPAAAGEISFTLAHPGNVSAAIYDADGRQVRELARAAPMNAGAHVLEWDGLDRQGVAQAPGSYTWKVLGSPGLEAKFLGVVGVTTVEQPYDPWVGNNDGPSALAWDESGWYVGSDGSEGVPAYRKQSPDGRKRIWQKDWMEAWQGPIAMASDKGALFVMQQNGKVVLLDRETGKHTTYIDDAGKARPLAWDVLAPDDNRSGSGGGATSPMDMDVHGGQLAVSAEKFNLVRLYSAVSPEVPARSSAAALEEATAKRLLRTEQVPAPRSVALGAEGVMLVISEGQVLAIGKERNVFIPAAALEHPYRLAVDHATGDVLVAEAAPAHQIKRFDRAGKLVATYGRKGGRQDGPFVATDFLNLRDVAATADGGFLVCEGNETLRRTAQFDRAGNLLGQWFGGSPFYNQASATAGKPDEVWFYAGYAALGVARMDFERRTWQLLATYRYDRYGDGLFPAHDPFRHWVVRENNGVTYVVKESGAVLRLDEGRQRLVPAAIAGSCDKKKAPKPWLDAVATQQLDLAKLSGGYTWSDLNADGEFQPEEFRFHAIEPGRGVPGIGIAPVFIDENWNLVIGQNTSAGEGAPWVTLPNLAEPGAAAPVWDWSRSEPAKAQWPAEIATLNGAECRGVWRGPDGAVYQIVAANRAPTADRHNPSFPGFRSGSVRLIRWNADGSIAWSVAKHSHREPFAGAKPGEYHDPTRILGFVHDCVVVADRSAWPASAWTADGLYAGSLLDRRADDGLPAYLYFWWREKRPQPDRPGEFVNPHSLSPDTPIPFDVLGGCLLPVPDGDPLWMPMGESATAVYRVGGWDRRERHEGQVKLAATPPHADAHGTGLAVAYYDNPRLEGEPVHERTDSRLWFGHKIGAAKWLPWSKDPVPGIAGSGFSARWTGFLEPRFTEPVTFSAYIGPTDRVRLWIDDQLVIDDWAPADPKRRRPRQTDAGIDEVVSQPVPLTAGRRVAIRLEYASEGPEQGSLSANWDSFTQERQRIPTAFLYPTVAP